MQLTTINNKYELYLPEHRAARPEWATGWEVKRIEAMLACIVPEDLVFDIGTEAGDISALIAEYTNCNMVLFEPNNRVWPIIKQIWAANNLREPVDFYGGFLSNETRPTSSAPIGWDDISGDIIPDHGFKQLYESDPDIPQITLDEYCNKTGLYPTVITMDVEGSEFNVIKGAEQTLLTHRPTVFMSVHPVFMKDHYNQWAEHLLKFMRDDMGYEQHLIDYDHELHIQFTPKK